MGASRCLLLECGGSAPSSCPSIIPKESMKKSLVLSLACLLAGCASNPEKFYHSTGRGPNEHYSGVVSVLGSADLRSDAADYRSNGYVVVGSSDFIGPISPDNQFRDQAKRVGASVVLVHSTFRNTIHGTADFDMPNLPQRVTTQTSGDIRGSTGGSIYYNSTTTTMVPSEPTHYSVPYVIDRYETHALYL